MVGLSACGERGQEAGQNRMRDELNPPPAAYTKSAPCGLQDEACQTLVDFYKRKPGFKETFIQVLSAAEMNLPLWIERALTTSVQRVQLDGDTLLIGQACEPRNCAEVFYVGYVESTQQMFGFYRTNNRLQWFGVASDAEKERLCAEDQLCTLEDKVSEIPALLTRFGFPSFVQPSDFSECKEYKGGITAKNGFACRDQFVRSCPMGSAGCTVASEFVNEQLASISYKYNNLQIKNDGLKKTLNNAYGKSETQQIKAEGAIKATTWITEWQDGRVRITLRRVKGGNVQGGSYDDVWVVFVDQAFALFN